MINKIVSDNSILKKGITKLFHKDQENSMKIGQFDNLVSEYTKLKEENEMLKKQNAFLQYSQRGVNASYTNTSFNSNRPGSGGVF